MKKNYDGLQIQKIDFGLNSQLLAASGPCPAMIQLKMEHGICISPEWMQQIEYVGDQG